MSGTQTVWRKSSRSMEEQADCVEVACLGTTIGVRDSKDPSGPALAFGRPAWRQFVNELNAGAYDGRRRHSHVSALADPTVLVGAQ